MAKYKLYVRLVPVFAAGRCGATLLHPLGSHRQGQGLPYWRPMHYSSLHRSHQQTQTGHAALLEHQPGVPEQQSGGTGSQRIC